MKPITLPTSPEIRKELRDRRWQIDHEDEGTERWRCHDGQGVIRLKEGLGVTWIEGWPSVVLPALAILGQLAPKGMVMVPKELAQKYVADVDAFAAMFGSGDRKRKTELLHDIERNAMCLETVLRMALAPETTQETPTPPKE